MRSLIILKVKRLLMLFNNIHLREKLLICYGSLIVFSVVMVGLFSYYNIQKYIYNQASGSYIQTMEQMNMNIESRLNIFDEVLGHIISDKEFIYALSTKYDSPADYSYEYLNQIMKTMDFKAKYKNILGVIVYKINDTLPEDGEDLQNIENLKGMWWFEKYFKNYCSQDINEILKIANTKLWIVTDEDVVSPFIKENLRRKTPVKKIAIIKPIMLNTDQVVGLIEVYIDYDSVFSELNVSKSGSQKNEITIVDQVNNPVFISLSPQNKNFQFKKGYVKPTQEHDEGSFLYKNGTNSNIVVYERGRYSNWMYYMEVPMSQLLNGAKTIKIFTILVATVSILVSIILGIFIAGLISSRISEFSRRMDGVEDLSLDVEVRLSGKDEIGNLARSFNRMIRKIQDLVSELRGSQQMIREAELKAMQSQINPHFLYNTLATINWMAMDGDNEKIISMVDNLAMFYRLSLNKGKEFLKIEEEINHIKAYGDIQKVRLEDKINLWIEVDEDIKRFYTMKLILQPFIENAIMHGSKSKEDSTTNIIIRGYKKDESIVLNVIDDGIGMREVPNPENYPTTGGYGIRNVHEKIQLQFGREFGVKLFSRPGIGTTASIIIPVILDIPKET